MLNFESAVWTCKASCGLDGPGFSLRLHVHRHSPPPSLQQGPVHLVSLSTGLSSAGSSVTMPPSSPLSLYPSPPPCVSVTGSRAQHRPWILAAYGMWACWCVLGAAGTAMVFLHTIVAFCVAQFRSLFLSWLCSLLLLSTLRLQDVEEMKVSVSLYLWEGGGPSGSAPIR